MLTRSRVDVRFCILDTEWERNSYSISPVTQHYLPIFLWIIERNCLILNIESGIMVQSKFCVNFININVFNRINGALIIVDFPKHMYVSELL